MSAIRPHINYANRFDRVIILIDMDCFYCQVEEKLNPELQGKPIAVVQYNPWRGGGIIAVNYPARARGVTRHMRGDDAKEQCPEIQIIRTPSEGEKADLSKYRDAGHEVATVLQSFGFKLERASVDEAYLDITKNVIDRVNDINEGKFLIKQEQLQNTYVVGYDHIGTYLGEIAKKIGSHDESDDEELNDDGNEQEKQAIQGSDMKLLVGASIANEIRAKVKEKTGYDCSAGIAHNKILAKFACGINKPNKQTVLPLNHVDELFSTLPVKKIKGLGGKLGDEVCDKLKVKFMGDLLQFSQSQLQKVFDEKNGSWLYMLARGIDLEAVVPRFYSKSIGCCKKFPGQNCIVEVAMLDHWLRQLAKEICDRVKKDMEENKRRPTQMIASFVQEINSEDISSSRSTALNSTYGIETLANEARELIKKNTNPFLAAQNDTRLHFPIKFLGISVGKFQSDAASKKGNSILSLFQNCAKKKELAASEESSSAATTNLGTDSREKTLPAPVQKPEVEKSKGFFANYFKKKQEESLENQKSENESSSYVIFVTSKIADNNDLNEAISELQVQVQHPQENLRTPSPRAEMQSENKNSNDCETPNKADKYANSFFAKFLKNSPNSKSCEPSTSRVSEESVNLEPTETNYEREYAEFRSPQITEDQHVICDQCGRKILSYSMPTHLDYHFALGLSQQQREEFRSELKKKTITPPPSSKATTKNAKPVKKTSASTDAKKNGNIKALFTSLEIKLSSSFRKEKSKVFPICSETIEVLDDSQPSTSIANLKQNGNPVNSEITGDQIACVKCGKSMPTDEMPTHLDFHFAMEVSQELKVADRNKQEVKSVTSKRGRNSEPLSDSAKKLKQVNISKLLISDR